MTVRFKAEFDNYRRRTSVEASYTNEDLGELRNRIVAKYGVNCADLDTLRNLSYDWPEDQVDFLTRLTILWRMFRKYDMLPRKD